MLNKYVDFNKCNCNLYDIKQLINILNMDNVEDTIEYAKKDIFNAMCNYLLSNGVYVEKVIKDFNITVF